jgi:hypothetical protein
MKGQILSTTECTWEPHFSPESQNTFSNCPLKSDPPGWSRIQSVSQAGACLSWLYCALFELFFWKMKVSCVRHWARGNGWGPGEIVFEVKNNQRTAFEDGVFWTSGFHGLWRGRCLALLNSSMTNVSKNPQTSCDPKDSCPSFRTQNLWCRSLSMLLVASVLNTECIHIDILINRLKKQWWLTVL